MTIQYDLNDSGLIGFLKSKYIKAKDAILTKNDKAWLCLIDKYKILDSIEQNNCYSIESKKINQFRESRLMAKFDHYINLPVVFQENNLSILPISRGEYFIAKMKTYHSLKVTNDNITYMVKPDNLESLDFENINSETAAINCALASGIFKDFLEDENLTPTIDGRMGSGQFSFEIFNDNKNFHRINVTGAQIEIDSGLEGVNYLSLIEAKRNLADDFLVRQLYYPFKTWLGRVTKPIKPVYLVYSNGIFHLNEYRFEDPNRYDSIQLVKSKNYTFSTSDITLDEITEIAKQKITEEPKVAFPQADNFERVINLGELLNENDKFTRDKVTEKYAFDVRQTNYYTDALRYLGLVERRYESNRQPYYILTEEGEKVFNSDLRTRKLLLIKNILEHEVFNKVFNDWLNNGRPNKNRVVELMKESYIYNIDSEDTYKRRASSVIGWIKWIFSLVE